jgi:hypothetical protein
MHISVNSAVTETEVSVLSVGTGRPGPISSALRAELEEAL